MANEEKEPRIFVDEDWKSRVEAEREQLRQREQDPSQAAGEKPETTAEPTGETAAGVGSEPPRSESEASWDTQSASGGASGQSTPQLPPATFSALVETLSMQAMASLSEATQPVDPSQEKEGLPDPRFHVAMAKYLIDTLDVLEQKTRGNLDGDEAQHLEAVLHDLRMAFVAIRKQVG